MGWQDGYATLPAHFYSALSATPVRAPRLLAYNQPLASELGLDLSAHDALQILSGNQPPHGSRSIAIAYAGHQFGHFVPKLGDGRALLLGEVTDRAGQRREIQLKGSGPTPYSRNGDGRAALGPVVREYIISEAMHALGIPTTRSLAVVATGEPVFRETALPGAVLTRVAASHIRIGTFEYFAAQGDVPSVQQLADYAIARHYPALAGAENPYLALLRAVMEAQAALVVRWMQVGFIHGVMNTDNVAISGETIDYGPCAFMDAYDPATVFSSIDRNGRYAFGRQPMIAQWNIARLAEALLPLLHAEQDKAITLAEEVIEAFAPHFQSAWLTMMRGKLGLTRVEAEDQQLVATLLETMQAHGLDYTNTFAGLSSLPADSPLAAWMAQWHARVAMEDGGLDAAFTRMQAFNPTVIPRNHKVEEAIQAAMADDLAPMERLMEVLAKPFGKDVPEEYRLPAVNEEPYRTFCGT